MTKRSFSDLLLAAAVVLLTLPAQAFYSTFTTGDMLAEDKYEAGVETQFVTSGDDGVNLVGRLDVGYNDESSFRGMLGFGVTDFQVGGFYKWVPIPDYDNQPAMGILAGAQYAKYNNESEVALRVHPFLSKKFEVDFGDLTPYAALPIGLRSYDGDTDLPLQLALGSRLRTDHFEKIEWMAEIGMNLSDAFTYISVSAVLEFDSESGLEFR